MSLPIVTEMRELTINKGNSRIGPPLLMWIVSHATRLALIVVSKMFSKHRKHYTADTALTLNALLIILTLPPIRAIKYLKGPGDCGSHL
jgi:hypothetical protein